MTTSKPRSEPTLVIPLLRLPRLHARRLVRKSRGASGASSRKRDKSQARSSADRRGKDLEVSPDDAHARNLKRHKDKELQPSSEYTLESLSALVAEYGSAMLEKAEVDAVGGVSGIREKRNRLQVEKGKLHKGLVDSDVTIKGLKKSQSLLDGKVKNIEVHNVNLRDQL